MTHRGCTAGPSSARLCSRFVKSAAGHAEGAFDETIQNALGAMMVRAQSALEAA